jgi:hypothetical protein
MSSIACRNGAEHIRSGANYELASYEGHALPAETFSFLAIPRQTTGNSVRCVNRLSRMNLYFESNSTFTQTESRVLTCDGRADVRQSEVSKGNYESSRGVATFSLSGEFGPVQSTGRFTGETLAVSLPRPLDVAKDSAPTTFPLIFIASK